jgi:alpha-N-acetylglucosaminidase
VTKISLTFECGTGVLSAAGAVNHYCRTSGLCSTSWGQTTKPSLPRPLPPVLDEVGGGVATRQRWLPHSYNMNFCTHSYTMAWWGWEEWERELDWMALHVVTMPLIALGREVVFRVLYREFGMSDEDILAYFTGPAFLAWHRMGNLKSFAGPMPPSYLEHSEKLTARILVRARELGMTPVLPGFSGHVPNQLEKLTKAPSGSFSSLPTWSGFGQEHSGLAFVEPTSELYLTLGKRFIEIQVRDRAPSRRIGTGDSSERTPPSPSLACFRPVLHPRRVAYPAPSTSDGNFRYRPLLCHGSVQRE